MEELDETAAEKAAQVRCVNPVEEHRRSRTTAAAEQAHSRGSLTVPVHLCASIRPHAHLYHPQLLPPHLSTELTRCRSAMLRLVGRCGACTLIPGRGRGRW